MALYLITHAHTQADPEQPAAGWHLSPAGQRQAQALAEAPFWSNVSQVVLSSQANTRLTVAPVLAQRSLPWATDDRFDELQRPTWVEDYGERVRVAFARPQEAAGDWERATAALDRFLDGIRAWTAQLSQATDWALVGHGLTFSLYRAHLLGLPQVCLADWQQLSFAAVARVDPHAGRLLDDFVPAAGAMPRGAG